MQNRGLKTSAIYERFLYIFCYVKVSVTLFLLTVHFRRCLYLAVLSEFLAPCSMMVVNKRCKEAVVA
jgi:hypothetical protein